MAGPEWSIVFFESGGHSPVREFLETLDRKTQVRFAWSLEQLRVRNVLARKPLVDHVEGKLWELREESGTNIYRLLYVMGSRKRIIVLHGFQKKTQRTPRREIEIAEARLRCLQAGERGT